MQVRDVMSADCQTCDQNDTLRSAAEKMARYEVGGLPVSSQDRLVGMLTDRDLTVRGTAQQIDPDSAQIAEIMTNRVYYCYDDQSTADVCRNMADLQVRRLPVVNRQKQLVGIVSLSDLPESRLPDVRQ